MTVLPFSAFAALTNRDFIELWQVVGRHRAALGDRAGAARARRIARLIGHRDGWRRPTMADLPAPQHLVPITWNRYRDPHNRKRQT